MTSIVETVEIQAAPARVFAAFTDFERFPVFMKDVDRVERASATVLQWHVTVGGVAREWAAEITSQVPPRELTWTSLDGAAHAGSVTFESTPSGGTTMTLAMEFVPADWIERAGDSLGIVRRRIAAELNRFKRFVEGDSAVASSAGPSHRGAP